MPIGGFAEDSFGDGIEFVYRRLMSSQSEVIAKLAVAYTVGDGQIQLTAPALNTIGPGTRFAIDQVVYRCDTWVSTGTNAGTATVTVTDGSADANHVRLSDVIINPKYVRWDIAVAIRHALNSLSSPTNGLYQVGTTTLTFNSVYYGYDLGAIPVGFNRILELTYDHPFPDRVFPPISRYRVLRGVTNSKFPSGRGIQLYRSAYPGFNINVAYGYPFTPLTDLSQEMTTSGLAPTAVDVPLLMAEVFLTESREIKRNFIENQPDVRKSTDVPAGAVANAINPLTRRISQRISEEADRLDQQWPRQRALT